jgi:hypothetical protein
VNQKAALNLKRKVIAVWVIVYDGNADRSYAFSDFDKALASIEGSIRAYLGDDDPSIDVLCQKVLSTVRARPNRACIPIRVNHLYITLYRWELDEQHPVHQILRECYDVVPPPLKAKIASLFFSSQR